MAEPGPSSARALPQPEDGQDYYFLEGFFLDSPPEKFSCPICLVPVQREAHLTACCGNHFCYGCIRKLARERRSCCPVCKHRYLKVFPNKERQREINALRVTCPLGLVGSRAAKMDESKIRGSTSPEGRFCSWEGELGHLEEHLKIHRNSLGKRMRSYYARGEPHFYRCEMTGQYLTEEQARRESQAMSRGHRSSRTSRWDMIGQPEREEVSASGLGTEQGPSVSQDADREDAQQESRNEGSGVSDTRGRGEETLDNNGQRIDLNRSRQRRLVFDHEYENSRLAEGNGASSSSTPPDPLEMQSGGDSTREARLLTQAVAGVMSSVSQVLSQLDNNSYYYSCPQPQGGFQLGYMQQMPSCSNNNNATTACPGNGAHGNGPRSRGNGALRTESQFRASSSTSSSSASNSAHSSSRRRTQKLRHNWQQRPASQQSNVGNSCPGAANSSRGNCRMQHQQETTTYSNEWSTSAGNGMSTGQQQQFHMYPSSTMPHYGPCHMYWYPTSGLPVPVTTTPDLCYPPPPPPPFQYHPHSSAAGGQREFREHSPSMRDMQSFNYYMY